MKQKKIKSLIFTIFFITIVFYGCIDENIYKSDKVDKLEQNENIYNNKDDIKVSEQESESTQEYSQTKEITEEEANEFVNDDVLNQLITDYNTISEFDVEQCKTGAYPFNAIMMCNGVYIMTYNSNSIFVDFYIEDLSDNRIYPVFRDFMKTLDESVNDDEISTAWSELLTGKYIGYKYYDIGNVKCMCWVKNMSNGSISYTVKTGCKK